MFVTQRPVSSLGLNIKIGFFSQEMDLPKEGTPHNVFSRVVLSPHKPSCESTVKKRRVLLQGEDKSEIFKLELILNSEQLVSLKPHKNISLCRPCDTKLKSTQKGLDRLWESANSTKRFDLFSRPRLNNQGNEERSKPRTSKVYLPREASKSVMKALSRLCNQDPLLLTL